VNRISFNLKGKELVLITDVICYFVYNNGTSRHMVDKEKIYYITTHHGLAAACHHGLAAAWTVACICDTCLEYYSTIYKIELVGNEDRIEIEKHIMENDFKSNLDGLCCKIGLEDLQAILNKVYNERCIREIIE
jgi:hypothetical protein